MKPHLENHFVKTVAKLERIERQILTRRGYCKDSRQHRLLIELIKEQIPNANSRSTARALR
jgi:hypothetical protein